MYSYNTTIKPLCIEMSIIRTRWCDRYYIHSYKIEKQYKCLYLITVFFPRRKEKCENKGFKNNIFSPIRFARTNEYFFIL